MFSEDFQKELAKILRSFGGGCYLNHLLELTLIPKTNAYIDLSKIGTAIELRACLLVSVCRDCFKTQFYKSNKRNEFFHIKNLEKLNQALDTKFTREDIEVVYQRLGNYVNQSLAIKFVESGYDMELLKHKED